MGVIALGTTSSAATLPKAMERSGGSKFDVAVGVQLQTVWEHDVCGAGGGDTARELRDFVEPVHGLGIATGGLGEIDMIRPGGERVGELCGDGGVGAGSTLQIEYGVFKMQG